MAELLSIRQVAEMFHLHEMTVRRHIKQGKLRAVKVGGSIRVRKGEVERFMEPVSAPVETIIPSPKRASPEEIARRRALFAEVMRLREKIGPIGITTDELIRQARAEEEERYA